MTTEGSNRSNEAAMHIAWSQRHFASLADGGVWGVPRSGLVFTRKGDKLVLTARMPHDPKMPISAQQLDTQQQADVRIITEKFKAAGIEVLDETRKP